LSKLKPIPIRNKYDLMHHNTPSFASTVVTWDTAKMGSITKKRVIEWLKTGKARYSRGDAASMYHQLRLRFGLPNYTVRPCTEIKHGGWNPNGYIRWENASDKLMQAINTVYQAERVMRRLAGANVKPMPWYLQKDMQDNKEVGYFYIEQPHDLTEVNKEIERIMASPEISAKRDEAVKFVEEGGKFTFTWRDDGNRSE